MCNFDTNWNERTGNEQRLMVWGMLLETSRWMVCACLRECLQNVSLNVSEMVWRMPRGRSREIPQLMLLETSWGMPWAIFGKMPLKMAQKLPRVMFQAKSQGIPWAMFWGMARGMANRKHLSKFLREHLGKCVWDTHTWVLRAAI